MVRVLVTDVRFRGSSVKMITTSLPKVVWEEGCVAALLHTDAVKSLLVTIYIQLSS